MDLVRYLVPMALYFGPIGIGFVIGAIAAGWPGAIVGALIGAGVTWAIERGRKTA